MKNVSNVHIDPLGYPDSSLNVDVLSGFKKSPPGYGQVPFYWWVGDRLIRDRLLWQLDELYKAGIQGFSVSYAHSHPQSDPDLNQNGYGTFGMTYPSDPPFFSDQWWELWNWFSGECAKRGMALGLDDYTLGVPGNNQWPDEIAALPEMRMYQGKIKFDKPIAVKGGETLELKFDRQTISLTAFRNGTNGLEGESAINLLKLTATNNNIIWTAPEGSEWQIFPISRSASFMLHPCHGDEVVKRYFQKFEDHVDPENRKGLNYFFQDELTIDLGIDTWSEDFAQQFQKRKGYDIVPYLAALHYDIGPRTPKIRIDYMDIVVDLAEERYFRPIFEWHQKRGLIFGCDNYGRGLIPTSYGDYFRVTRWFSAPGNDAPQGKTALVQTKVSSSISHLYHRPRVWLEAFHSMGWDARPEHITQATDNHYLLGGNLLCLHGLYYSTYGGWWEWAPPDFHFRMPYWPHMKGWFKYIERLSYLLSQGQHVCDVAVVYPTTPMHVYQNAEPNVAFSIADQLYNAGIDFDFIDYQSLAKAAVKDGQLHVAGEHYRVLILADLKAIRFTSLDKAWELFLNGGLVIASGALPEASDRMGMDDPELDSIVKDIFGLTATHALHGNPSKPQHSDRGGTGTFIPTKGENKIAEFIKNTMTVDFLPANDKGHVLHRRAGNRHIYMIMDVPKGTECFFRSHGKVELWDAWTGETQSLPVIRKTAEGTVLKIPFAPPKSSLIVFSPGEPEFERFLDESASQKKIHTMELTGNWECEMVPTLDNQWGDFRLPATNSHIGAEARQMRYASEKEAGIGWQDRNFDDSQWQQVTCDFGPRMWKMIFPPDKDIDVILNAVIGSREFFDMVRINGQHFTWTPYEFSWRWGIENQPGSQGYHGLKGNVDDNFLIMGEAGNYLFGSFLHIPKEMTVRVLKNGIESHGIWINGKKLEKDTIRLSQGFHQVIVCYKNITQGEGPHGIFVIDGRTRASLVFVDSQAGEGSQQPLAMKWYKHPGLLSYDYLAGASINGCYRFTAPPGLREMSFFAYGDVKVWVDGADMRVERGLVQTDSAMAFTVKLNETVPGLSSVALQVSHKIGYYGGAAFPEPITLTCTKGVIAIGDWSKMGVLKHYSGGMWYRKNITLDNEVLEGEILLDLGQVVATCEVHVNGIKAGILVTAPYCLDISPYVKNGDNRLEILVYNTLSNHYQTIPTPEFYKKTTISGLIGPVRIICNKNIK